MVRGDRVKRQWKEGTEERDNGKRGQSKETMERGDRGKRQEKIE